MRCACRVLYGPVSDERLTGLSEAEVKLLEALKRSCGVSGRATVDLREIAMRIRMRDLTWRIALLGLRLARLVHVEHDPERFEWATVTLPKSLLQAARPRQSIDARREP